MQNVKEAARRSETGLGPILNSSLGSRAITLSNLRVAAAVRSACSKALMPLSRQISGPCRGSKRTWLICLAAEESPTSRLARSWHRSPRRQPGGPRRPGRGRPAPSGCGRPGWTRTVRSTGAPAPAGADRRSSPGGAPTRAHRWHRLWAGAALPDEAPGSPRTDERGSAAPGGARPTFGTGRAALTGGGISTRRGPGG